MRLNEVAYTRWLAINLTEMEPVRWFHWNPFEITGELIERIVLRVRVTLLRLPAISCDPIPSLFRAYCQLLQGEHLETGLH